MTIDIALQLIEIGVNIADQVISANSPGSNISQSASKLALLIQRQAQVYQQATGKSIDEVIQQLTFIDPNVKS